MSGTSKMSTDGLCDLCLYCYINNTRYVCLAYPDGAPEKYWEGIENHTVLVGDEAGEYFYKKATSENVEKYRDSGIHWYSMERIKDMGLIKNKGEE